jgi:serine/threonine protein kinase
MNILKKGLYANSTIRTEVQESFEQRPTFSFKIDRSNIESRENNGKSRSPIQIKFNNFMKVGSRERLGLDSTSNFSKKSFDNKHFNENNSKKSPYFNKIKIHPESKSRGAKPFILKELGSPNGPLRGPILSKKSSVHSTKNSTTPEGHFFQSEKNLSINKNHSPAGPQFRSKIGTSNLSKSRIPSLEKSANEPKNFKISVGNLKEPIFIKKQADRSPQQKQNLVDSYLKMEKFVFAKARSIDPKKKESSNAKSFEKVKRAKFLSEDKDQTKYMLREKPNTHVSVAPELKKEISLILKNPYYQLLIKKINENEDIVKLATIIREEFKDWKQDSLAEIYNFKSKIKFYKIRQEIGKGCFGKVYLANQILTGSLVALKIISKSTITNKDSRMKIEKEVEILKKVNGHHAVIKLFEVFEDDSFVYMVFEYLQNGDLVKYFKKQPLLNEPELKSFFFKIVKGIEYLHKNGIIHRDIKLDNILLDHKFRPKVCDFGISSIIEPNKKIYDTGGTPAYLAPEVIKAEGQTGPKSDVWSLGVLLYLLYFGIVPFKAKDMQVLYNKIIVGTYKFIDISDTSSELIDLIKKILIVDVDLRFDVDEILSHPWLAGQKESIPQNANENKNRNEIIKEGISIYLQNVGFPESFISQSINKGLFNHVKSCFDAFCDKFVS